DDEGEDDRLLEILKRYGYQPSDDKGQDTRSYTTATNELKKVAGYQSKHRKNAYAVLRRGIIEGCQRISSLIENHPEFIQFGDFIIDSNGTAVRDVIL
ncbi:hypothetical protein PN36_27745, partial [Candidatus Thiomargarita nelsonii]